MTAIADRLSRAARARGVGGGYLAATWLVAVLLMFVIALTATPVPGVVIAAALIGAPLLLIRYAVPAEDRRPIIAIVVGGIAIRLLIGTAVVLLLREQVFAIFDDTVRYVDIGSAMARAWHGGSGFDLFAQYRLTVAGYYYVSAALSYLAGGNDPSFLLVVFNAAIAGVTAAGLDVLGRALSLRRSERLGAIALATFIPSVLFWSALPLKDTLVTCALVGGVIAAFRLRRPDAFALALLAVSIVITASLRLYAILFLAAVTAFILLFGGVWRRFPAWAASAAVLVAALEFFSLQGPVGALITLAATDVGEIERQRSLFDQGGSALGAVDSPTTTPRATIGRVTTAPATLTVSPRPSPTPTLSTSARAERYLHLTAEIPGFAAQFFVQPIPFVTHGTLVLFALPEMFLWYLAMPLVVIGLVAMWRRQRLSAVALLVISLGMAVVYGTLVSNAGSLIRYRAPMLVLLALPTMVGALIVRRWIIERRLSDPE